MKKKRTKETWKQVLKGNKKPKTKAKKTAYFCVTCRHHQEHWKSEMKPKNHPRCEECGGNLVTSRELSIMGGIAKPRPPYRIGNLDVGYDLVITD